MIPALIVVGFLLIIGGSLVLMYHKPKNSGASSSSTAENITNTKYSSDMNRFQARREAGASLARGEVLSAVTAEITHLSKTIDAEALALKSELNKEDVHYNHSLGREKTQVDHESYVALADNTRTVANMATQLGLDPATMKELILEKARMETQLSAKFQEMQLEVHKHKQLSEIDFKREVETHRLKSELDFKIEIEKHRLTKDVDFVYEKKMAELETNIADIANLLPQHELNLLHTQLSGIHSEFDYVNTLPAGEFKDRELKRVQAKMKTWEKEIRERTKRLH